MEERVDDGIDGGPAEGVELGSLRRIWGRNQDGDLKITEDRELGGLVEETMSPFSEGFLPCLQAYMAAGVLLI